MWTYQVGRWSPSYRRPQFLHLLSQLGPRSGNTTIRPHIFARYSPNRQISKALSRYRAVKQSVNVRFSIFVSILNSSEKMRKKNLQTKSLKQNNKLKLKDIEPRGEQSILGVVVGSKWPWSQNNEGEWILAVGCQVRRNVPTGETLCRAVKCSRLSFFKNKTAVFTLYKTQIQILLRSHDPRLVC